MSDWIDSIRAAVETDRALAKAKLRSLGYVHPRQLPNEKWIALMPQLFTTALMVGINDWSYERRYCYENARDAKAALETWDGVGDPPGPWIKEKPSERLGPGAIE